VKDNLNRRNLFKLAAATFIALPIFKLKNVFAADAIELASDACPAAIPEAIKDKLAKDKAKTRLKFVTDATSSDHKKYTPGEACGNCKFYKTKIKDGKITGESGSYAKCSMLANKYVNRCGWCKSYKKDKKKFAIYSYIKKDEA